MRCGVLVGREIVDVLAVLASAAQCSRCVPPLVVFEALAVKVWLLLLFW